MSTEQDHYNAALKFQAYYDDALRKVGMRAPQPVLGQTVNDYRRETLRTLKKTFLPTDHKFYKVQMRGLPADILQGFEPQVLQAAVDEAYNPQNVPKGELRKIEEFDEYGKVKFIKWIGQQCFTTDFTRPGRRVVSFMADGIRMDANGRGLR